MGSEPPVWAELPEQPVSEEPGRQERGPEPERERPVSEESELPQQEPQVSGESELPQQEPGHPERPVSPERELPEE